MPIMIADALWDCGILGNANGKQNNSYLVYATSQAFRSDL